MNDRYEAIIGLEIHVQLKTASKMFCSCDNRGEEQPINTTICPVCTGQPGVLPVPNQLAIDMGVMAAVALHCRIPTVSKFDRKSYFYPDLPKGYQISQYDEPVGVDGYLHVQVQDALHRIGITRLHLEEDAAKLLHPEGKSHSIVDFNRAGTPLAEIVTEPDIRSPAEAKAFLQELRLMMRYLGVSDADMEKGHLRCDANISLRPRGAVLLSPKTEIKNLNSFRAVERALAYEIGRQTELWNANAPDAVQTTRGWDDGKSETVLQRTKEEASDYRYFPEPDIPPLHLTSEYVRNITARMPELPERRRQRFGEQYALAKKDIDVLVNDKDLGDFFEEAASELQAWLAAEKRSWKEEGPALMKQLANWLINRLQTYVTEKKKSLADSAITPENFAEFVKIVSRGTVNNQGAQQVLALMFETGHDPSDIIEREGLGQMQDSQQLAKIVQEIVDANPKVVADVCMGKGQAKKFLVGKVMAATKGTANPMLVATLLDEKLSA